MAKTDVEFPDLGQFIAQVVKRSPLTAGDIAKRGGLTRGGATISDLKNGTNAKWDTIDRFARGAGFRGGALEMFTVGGDKRAVQLLRVWRSLDEEARNELLAGAKRLRAEAEEPTAT